jgi:glycosyltransferase involved in cell wall biosynthesis
LIDTAEFRVLKGLVGNGHEVHALLPRKTGDSKHFSYHGISVHEFKEPVLPEAKSLMPKILYTIAQYLFILPFILSSMNQYSTIVRTYGKPDVVYGYMPKACLVAYIVSRLYRIPNITRLFGTFLYASLSSARDLFVRAECLELFAFELPCKYLIITNDETRGDEAASRLRIPQERVKYWMDGADFLDHAQISVSQAREQLQLSKDTSIILSVCRLTGWKRVDRIIQAVPEIVKTNKNVRVLIIGEGEERQGLENLCQSLSVKDIVVFMGAIPHKEVELYFHAADLFISLYDVTNFTNSTIEAMSCGKCILALKSGATSRMLKNGENAVLISYDDLERVPGIITNLLEDEALREKLGNNARQYALKSFRNWEDRVSIEVKLVESLLKDACN